MINAYEGNEPYIFISYSHKDSDSVLPIIEALQQKGFRIWYDSGIQAGTEWPEFIAGRLMNCHAVIAFMSRSAQDSHNCRREIHFSIELKKELLVVYLEDVELSPGMRLQLGALQAMFRKNSASDEEFISRLSGAAMLKNCCDAVASPFVGNTFDFNKKAKPEFCNRPKPERKYVPAARSQVEILTETVRRFNASTAALYRFKTPSELKEKQITNALRAFPFSFTRDDILFLFDDTLFENGKSGYLITEGHFYSTGLLLDKFDIDLKALCSANVYNKDHIIVTYDNGANATHFFNNNAKHLIDFFNIYFEERNK